MFIVQLDRMRRDSTFHAFVAQFVHENGVDVLYFVFGFGVKVH